MSYLKLFFIHAGQAVEIEGKSVGLEKSLQQLIEQHLVDLGRANPLIAQSYEAS